jgi:glycosyltransferase involved in cell wall biosynthesis
MTTEGMRSGVAHVLRLCSVFEPHPDALRPERAGFDPIGGMQNHTGTLTRCLDELGLTQTVVTSRLGGPRGVSPIGARGLVVRVGLPMRRLRQLWALLALPHVLRPRRRVDVVHAHQGEDLALLPLGLLAARRHRCPLVVTMHTSNRHTLRGNSPRARLLRGLGGAIERAVLRHADGVIVYTRRTASALCSDGVPAARMRFITSGFDPSLFEGFEGNEPDPFPEVPRPRVGYVGRLVPPKNPRLLVCALPRMAVRASLVLVGDGSDRRRIEAEARQAGVADRVFITGFLPHEQVPAVLRSLDVLVLPSAYEEFGSILIEAAAVGLPVVATDVNGIPEAVLHGETGLLVPPGDVAALVSAVDCLLGDRAFAARCGAAAKQRSQAYAWPVLARQVHELYCEVAATGRPASAQPSA